MKSMMRDATKARGALPSHERCGGMGAGRSGRGTKELVKMGMSVCLGALVVTGMSRGPGARRWHVLAGTALVGLSFCHHFLYAPGTKKTP